MNPSAPVFETLGLTKFYGSARGVEDISLHAGRGEIFGFLGPNGAGKTTVIRSALGLLRPTRGEVRLFGDTVRVAEDHNHEHIGYLPADLRLWPRMTGRSVSDLLMGLGGGTPDRVWRDELARRLEISLDRRIRNLSLGNRQKIGLMLALQHRPKLAILDEPTSGLDPLVRRVVMETLNELAAAGMTVVYSSHNLGEVEQICSRVGILRKGRLVALKSIEEIRTQRERALEFTFTDPATAPAELPEAMKGFRLIQRTEETWQVAYHGSPDELIRWLAQYGVSELASPVLSLEEAFLDFYRDDVDDAATADALAASARG